MKVLLIDAYDSFVHIIYQYLLELKADVHVVRNNKITSEEIKDGKYDIIILGPGPGHPKDSGYLKIINDFKGIIPIFGICLGMQAIVMAFNGNIIKSESILHGKTSLITHSNIGIFQNIANPIKVGRYHSLVADISSFPASLNITATANDDNNIMGIKHKTLPIEGVQFHPESIMTINGLSLINNILKTVK